jgi:hypothetical protein
MKPIAAKEKVVLPSPSLSPTFVSTLTSDDELMDRLLST